MEIPHRSRLTRLHAMRSRLLRSAAVLTAAVVALAEVNGLIRVEAGAHYGTARIAGTKVAISSGFNGDTANLFHDVNSMYVEMHHQSRWRGEDRTNMSRFKCGPW